MSEKFRMPEIGIHSDKKEYLTGMQSHDQEYAERKESIFQELKKLVLEKRSEDASFVLTTKILDELVRKNKSKFLGLTSGASVLRYWSGELKYLREKIDTSIKDDSKP